MNRKVYAIIGMTVALAFCFLSFLPVEESDAATDAASVNLGNVTVGTSDTGSYTFTGGRWNDTIDTGPTVTSTTNCTAVPTSTRLGSPNNWQWSLGAAVTPTSPGPFSCTVYMKTKGGFLTASDEYSVTISGTGLPDSVTVTGGPWIDAYGTVTITYNGNTISDGATVPYGATVTYTANVAPGRVFSYWWYHVGGGAPQTSNSPTLTLVANGDVNATMYAGVNPIQFNFQSSNSAYGTVSKSSLEVEPPVFVSATGITLLFGAHNLVYAYPSSSTAQYLYYFDGWYNSNGQLITSSQVEYNTGDTFTARFHRELRSYTVTVSSNEPAYGLVNGQSSVSFTVPYGTAISNSGGVLTIGSNTVTATPTTDDAEYSYAFSNWSNGSGTVTGNMTITANFIRSTENYQVSFEATPSYGTFQPVDSLMVPYGSEITVNGSTITINNVDISAVPNASDGTYTYSFVSWDVTDGDLVTEDTTITATFSRSSLSSGVHWSNGYQNGKVTMVFDWSSEDMMDHNMVMELYSGTVNSDQTTTWSPNGFTLNISLSYPTTNFGFDLQLNGTSVLTKTATAGKWAQYELTMDFTNGQVYMTPLRTFTSFIEYETLDSQMRVLFDFGSSVRNSTVSQIDHEDTGSGDHVRFSVTDTDVFLNTYGIVMNSPTINIYNHFPQYDQVRVNFYAFALYGSAITINGVSFPVDGSTVTIGYATTSEGKHVLPSMLPSGLVTYRTFALTNISVMWNGTNCLLTFENDRFTIDLGTYSSGNETVSFAGIWYFTAVLYEPNASVQKELGDWKMLPDIGKDAMLIIFLGIIVLVGAAVYIKFDGSLIDLLIIGGAAITAFVLIG